MKQSDRGLEAGRTILYSDYRLTKEKFVSFRREKDMSPLVQSWLKAQGLIVKAEFTAPWGICDFVALSFDSKRVRERLRLGQRRPIGSLLRVALLHHIPDSNSNGRTAVTIRRLGRDVADLMDQQRLAGELRRLVADRFVRFTRRDVVQKLNGWAPLHRRVVAVEVKLDRVREALAQARSHLRFADHALVALPGPVATRVVGDVRADCFRAAGVGVLAVWDRHCEALLQPRERPFRVDPILQAHCAERFWRTMPRDIGA